MVSVAGSKKLKRQMAPAFWGISRKNKRFVVTVRPGQHPRALSVPTAVLLRDVLGVVRTLREAKSAIYSGGVKVDGVVRKSLHHGIGLMDTVELRGSGAMYRMVPREGQILRPVAVDSAEMGKKICKVTSKVTIRGGRTQVGMHDGRSVITGADVRVGDSCVISVPGQEMGEVIRLEAGCLAMVTRGANAGATGTVDEIKRGTFVLPAMATMSLGDRRVDVPAEIVMAIGRGEPAVSVA